MDTSTLTATKWAIDPTHSEVQFKVKHLVISTVTGTFKNFEGTVITETEDWDTAKINFSIDTASIETGQEQRDVHLKSSDFFDSETYPQIKFVSGSIRRVSDNVYKVAGDLTIKEVTKPVELDVEFGGKADDFYGNTKAGFEISGKIKRKEFGLTWDGVTEAGSIVVGDEVKLIANVQLTKEQ